MIFRLIFILTYTRPKIDSSGEFSTEFSVNEALLSKTRSVFWIFFAVSLTLDQS